jgi:transposase
MEITTIGLDIAKSVFQVHGVDADGTVVLRRKLRRADLIAFFEGLSSGPDRHGGLRRRTLLGPGAGRARP